MAPQIEPPEFLYDIVIVGAGPCGLAVAARLRERTPSAIFTDQEHQRYHWIRQHQTSIRSRKTGRIRQPEQASAQQYSMLVLDSTSDEWVGRWRQLFAVLQIDELRSPSFFHVDPSDRDALLAFAHENDRMDEMREIRGVVGKEVSKHWKKKKTKKYVTGYTGGYIANNTSIHPRESLVNERDRKDYFTPSAKLFEGHCKQCINRYDLSSSLIRHEMVRDIVYDYFADVPVPHKTFLVKTNGCQYFARTVVLAIGGGNAPAIPSAIPNMATPGACHAMQMRQCPAPEVVAKIRAGKQTNVLVVGGGLTSAQVSDLATHRGVCKVWHIMRGPMKGLEGVVL